MLYSTVRTVRHLTVNASIKLDKFALEPDCPYFASRPGPCFRLCPRCQSTRVEREQLGIGSLWGKAATNIFHLYNLPLHLYNLIHSRIQAIFFLIARVFCSTCHPPKNTYNVFVIPLMRKHSNLSKTFFRPHSPSPGDDCVFFIPQSVRMFWCPKKPKRWTAPNWIVGVSVFYQR